MDTSVIEPTPTPNQNPNPEPQPDSKPNPFLRFYKNGRIQRPIGTPYTPASTDPITGVTSKDIIISTEPPISARLYLPPNPTTTLPLLIYFHGGAFCIESAFSTLYHSHLNSLTAAAGVLAVSVEYRLAPEHFIPACYDDAWETLKWVQQSPDPWIQQYADLNRVFLAGDSAGGNISHNLAVRAGLENFGSGQPGLRIVGMMVVHPYFEYEEASELWLYISPGTGGIKDRRINPGAEPGLVKKIVCGKVLLCVAGEDKKYGPGGVSYYETLKEGGYSGEVEYVFTEGKGHVFHLNEPECEEARRLMSSFVSFLNQKDGM